MKEQYQERLKLIKSLCLKSSFFSSHELIGSSLLFVHDENKASVWMIDFEKTRPANKVMNHDVQWVIIIFKIFIEVSNTYLLTISVSWKSWGWVPYRPRQSHHNVWKWIEVHFAWKCCSFDLIFILNLAKTSQSI